VLEFFKSDVGKVALGGLIALGGQLLVAGISWFKEARFAASKARKEAEYLAIRLVLVFDELTNDCYQAVNDPLMPDGDGFLQSSVPDPALTLPEGDYKTLPRHLMYEVLSMPNRLESIKEGMVSAWQDSTPPDYDELFEYRREHLARLGIRALGLIASICEAYKIPLPERPNLYTPWQSFQDELISIGKAQRDRTERNRAMAQGMWPMEDKVASNALHKDNSAQ